jgi:alkanesulfonate monooxygenase SsuD/methylene tetrahydromethanopterin reductase-like flavin-dependent oxidoreductase (luciferase family)/iron-sulfur cluster repair protein YtfE (RIC family)
VTAHGHDLLFGTFLTPSAEAPDRVVGLAQLTEQAGLDLVTLQDHPYQARFLDTWTLLSVIAARTSTVRVSPNVANLPLRPPAVLARSAATLDLLSGGRVELGLGAGAFWDAIAAMGASRRTPPESVAALEEAIEVIRAVWDTSARSVRVDGEHYRVKGMRPGPAPAHDIAIWVGAYKPRMLRLTGRLADGWLPSSSYAGPEALARMTEVLDEAAVEAGRDPAAVRRLYNVEGRFQPQGSGFLQGPPQLWAEQLAELTLTVGTSAFILVGDDADAIRRFGAEVAPAVRELVEAERTSPSPGSDHPPTAAPTTVSTDPDAGTLPVAATPDDGVRLSSRTVWDEATRPTGPAPEPDRGYTPHQQAAGQHLVDVHDHLRQELAQLRDLVEQVAAGDVDPGAARSHIATMTIRQNRWTVGAYCASYCRVVTTHHTLEDRSMFPHLRSADPRLAPVIDRLEEEHHAIHDVLEEVDRALVSFVAGPEGVRTVKQAVDLLTDTLLSHLSYEERELVEPLARLGLG